MPTTFIDFKSKGYWVPDSLIAITAKYMARAMLNEGLKEIWQQEYLLHLEHLTLEHYPGWASLLFDKVLTNADRIDAMIRTIHSATQLVLKEGEHISPASLFDFNPFEQTDENTSKWPTPIPSEKIAHILNTYIQIIEEKKGLDAASAPYLTL
ncbi:MAG: hypothetical protein K1X77_11635 [Bacteroidia bacterium]|nr:hypothetical protein [Bacteroidia bacterium]